MGDSPSYTAVISGGVIKEYNPISPRKVSLLPLKEMLQVGPFLVEKKSNHIPPFPSFYRIRYLATFFSGQVFTGVEGFARIYKAEQ